jgi:protein O-GlcNAc transferase
VAFQTGRFAQAVASMRRAIALNPKSGEFYSNLGSAHDALGQREEAISCYQQALRLQPDYAAAHSNLANVLYRQGRAEEAVAHYRCALRLKPNNAEAHCNLGVALADLGNAEEAVRNWLQALDINPDYADAHNNLGNALHKKGNMLEAETHYRHALRVRPDFAEAQNNLGTTHSELGRAQEAVACFREALRLNPNFAEAWNNLGNALALLDQLDEAVRYFQQATRIKPDYADAFNNMGNAFLWKDELDDAVASFRAALVLDPCCAEAHNGMAHALERQDKLEEALGACRSAVGLKPDFADAHNQMGTVLLRQEKLDDAVRCFQEALRLEPDFVEVHNNLGCAHLRLGRLDLARTSFEHAFRLRPQMTSVQSNLLFCLNYDPEADPQAVFAEHRRWGRLHALPPAPPHANDPAPGRRLRIGYVSPDFRGHALARYFEPVLAHHDPDQVEVFCYAEVAQADATTARLQKMAHGWRRTYMHKDAQVADCIRGDAIDILVDLAGHTGNSRLGVFAHQPAPIQATWLGYMNTTGLTAVAYRLTDAVLDPPGEPVCDTEELVRLPGGMCCFAPPPDAPPVSPLPALRRGHITFGSLNTLFKLNARVFDLWSQLLQALPTARLLMLRDTLAGTAQEYIRRQFKDRGIASERLELRQGSAASGYLRVYGEIDISLDTFPCTGGVTTCESLWMGVPVISLRGVRPAARNSAALLARVDLGDWAVDTAEQYQSLALQWTNDLTGLARLRAELRDRTAATLCDAKRFTRELEEAFRTLWRRWCAQNPGGRPASSLAHKST